MPGSHSGLFFVHYLPWHFLWTLLILIQLATTQESHIQISKLRCNKMKKTIATIALVMSVNASASDSDNMIIKSNFETCATWQVVSMLVIANTLTITFDFSQRLFHHNLVQIRVPMDEYSFYNKVSAKGKMDCGEFRKTTGMEE